MRRFRAWDGKEMVLSPKEGKKYGLNGWFAWYVIHSTVWDGEQGSVIMQSTRLKDKNDMEIFVGDILATSNDDPKCDIWDDEEHGLTVVTETEDLGYTYSEWGIDPDDFNSVYVKEFVRIVGNIYENPELIK